MLCLIMLYLLKVVGILKRPNVTLYIFMHYMCFSHYIFRFSCQIKEQSTTSDLHNGKSIWVHVSCFRPQNSFSSAVNVAESRLSGAAALGDKVVNPLERSCEWNTRASTQVFLGKSFLHIFFGSSSFRSLNISVSKQADAHEGQPARRNRKRP